MAIGIVIATSLWTWKLLTASPVLATLAIILSILVFSSLTKTTQVLAIIFTTLVFFGLVGVNRGPLSLSQSDIYQINYRRSFFPLPLGRLFENKITATITKLERNFFFSLDHNLFLFAGHPRERNDSTEFVKYSWIFMPIFAIGFISLLTTKFKLLILYYLGFAALSSFTDLVLMYPFFTSVIAVGLLKVVSYVKK